MKVSKLRAILENLADLEDDNRVLIAVDGREWEIESVSQEYTGGQERCLVIDARIGSGRTDLQKRPSKGHRKKIVEPKSKDAQ